MIAISHLLNQSSSCFFHPDLKESANSPQLKHQNMFRLRALAFQRRSSSTQVKLIFTLVSCPTISSLYLYFGFCNYHLVSIVLSCIAFHCIVWYILLPIVLQLHCIALNHMISYVILCYLMVFNSIARYCISLHC